MSTKHEQARLALASMVVMLSQELGCGDMLGCNDDYTKEASISMGEGLRVLDAYARLAGLVGHVGMAKATIHSRKGGIDHLYKIVEAAERDLAIERNQPRRRTR